MNDTDDIKDIEVESRPVKVVRLTFLGSLAFWPLFVFAMAFMLGAPEKTAAAMMERRILVVVTWCYPVAVALGWFLSKRGLKRGSSDVACLLPWIIPALVACYWFVYFLL